ncbi:hypothetical protein GCM10010405_60290 [Streptomyces macrosporus]|uniref:Uncharacterized protein n=1 Tax=Streptomyces macrosporus TaxID=44032 RepID=A0ABP5XT74_9ACTN
MREVAVGPLHELDVGELPLLAEVGQLVLVAHHRQQGAGLAQQVQRDVGEGDLLLQDGGVSGPLPQALGEDQGVVAEGQRGRAGNAHRCCTPSGTS